MDMDSYERIQIEDGVSLYINYDDAGNSGDLMLSISKQVKDITRDMMLEIMDLAQRWCPVDTGFLKSTGQLLEGNGTYEIVYGAEYAKYVHSKYSNWLQAAYSTITKKYREAGIIDFIDYDTGTIYYKSGGGRV